MQENLSIITFIVDWWTLVISVLCVNPEHPIKRSFSHSSRPFSFPAFWNIISQNFVDDVPIDLCNDVMPASIDSKSNKNWFTVEQGRAGMVWAIWRAPVSKSSHVHRWPPFHTEVDFQKLTKILKKKLEDFQQSLRQGTQQSEYVNMDAPNWTRIYVSNFKTQTLKLKL